MLFKDIIRKKRDRKALSPAEIDFFVRGLSDGSLPAEQVSALAMAILLRSMTAKETGNLTLAMARSGTMIDWRSEALDGPIIDKHSTGGVGDKVSFLLAPIAAACGCFVPMISGRGLGHTGGTLDKIESIPGYKAVPGLDAFKSTVRSVGCAIIGQTDDLAPADRRLYAIRDVTGTVESVPLITASILSKKVAAGNEGLVMDIKTGSGAFMKSIKEARTLGKSIQRAGKAAGLKMRALITDMSETLGETAGNAVEIRESVAYLKNEHRSKRLDAVVMALAAEMVVLGGLEKTVEAAGQRAEKALTSGAAAEIFGRMVAALGGPADFLERSDDYLPAAPVVCPVLPEESGFLCAVDAHAIGNAIIGLGGGRAKADDTLDLSVGFTDVAPIGTEVGDGRPLAMVHARSKEDADEAAGTLRAACLVGNAPPDGTPVIYERF